MSNAPFVTEKALYLTEDKGRVVEEGDPDARWLVAYAGDVVDQGVVDQYGLAKTKQAAPPKNKQRTKAGDK